MNIQPWILERIYSIFQTHGLRTSADVIGTFDPATNRGTLTLVFGDTEEDIYTEEFKYLGDSENGFIERLMDTGGALIRRFNLKYRAPEAREAFIAKITVPEDPIVDDAE